MRVSELIHKLTDFLTEYEDDEIQIMIDNEDWDVEFRGIETLYETIYSKPTIVTKQRPKEQED